MNRNRHMQYRRSIYRKRRIRVIIITAAIVLALLVAIFLILGNVLFDKTNEDDGETANTSADTLKNDTLFSVNAREIKASAISLDGTFNSISSALDSAKADGFCFFYLNLHLLARDSLSLYAARGR